jgi:hypothetical protein
MLRTRVLSCHNMLQKEQDKEQALANRISNIRDEVCPLKIHIYTMHVYISCTFQLLFCQGIHCCQSASWCSFIESFAANLYCSSVCAAHVTYFLKHTNVSYIFSRERLLPHTAYMSELTLLILHVACCALSYDLRLQKESLEADILIEQGPLMTSATKKQPLRLLALNPSNTAGNEVTLKFNFLQFS